MKILMLIPALVWLVISALFFAVGEYLSKRWGMNPSFNFAVIVVLIYALGTFAWLPALLHKNQLAIMGTAWLLLAVMATVCVGVFVFHEKITNLQIIGVILAIIALGILGI